MNVLKNFEIRSWHVLAAITCLVIYMYAFNVPPKTNGEELLFWGYMHIFLHGTSIAIYFMKSTRKSSYPFIAYFNFFQLIGFGVPVFLISRTKFLFAILSVESLEYSFYAYTIIYSVFWIFSLFLFRRLRPFQAISQISIRRLNIVLSGFLVLIIADYLKIVPSLNQLVSLVKNVYIGLSLLLIFQQKMRTWAKVAFFIIMVVEILNRAVSGLISDVAFLLLFIIVVFNICSIRLTYLLPLIIPFLLFYSAFSKVKFIYRDKVWYSKRDFSTKDKLSLIYDLSQTSSQKTRKLDRQGKDNFFHRYSYPSAIFARVLRRTPAMVPYWNGTTYVSFFTKFIPRALWADKPKETLFHDFGVKYGIIRESDKVTAINTPILVEMFINFGLTGLFIGSALFGILLLFIDRYFCSNIIGIENKIIMPVLHFHY